MVMENSGFHMRKNFFQNYQQLGHEPSKMFVGLVLGPKLSKNTSLNGYQMNGQPGAAIGTRALKNVRWPCSRPKTFKEY